MLDEYPNVVIGCVDGGSNFAGKFPLLRDNLNDTRKNLRVIAVE